MYTDSNLQTGGSDRSKVVKQYHPVSPDPSLPGVPVIRGISRLLNISDVAPLHRVVAKKRTTYSKSKGNIRPHDCDTYSCSLLEGTSRDYFGKFLEENGYKGEGAEIGVFEGGFSHATLSNWHACTAYYAIDPYSGSAAQTNPDISSIGYRDQDDLFSKTGERLRHAFGNKVKQLRKPSTTSSRLFITNQLTYLYIDGLHDFEPVLSDLRLFYPKVRSGGIVAGHDYHRAEVGAAVRAFFNERPELQDTPVFITDEQPPSFIFVKP